MRIAIADDEALFRKGIAALLAGISDMELVLEAANGQELLDSLAQETELPDLILLDLNMPGLNGVETAKQLLANYPELKFVVLSSYFSKAFVLKMVELGAAAYLAKNSTPDQMETTIREVAKSGFYYDQQVVTIIRENMVKKSKPKIPNSFRVELTRRESEILQLICEEKTNIQIGQELFISPRTVDGHRNNLLSKLGCKNVAGLVVVAIQEGLVQIDKFRY